MERIAFCGVDCAVCPDFTGGKCPDCRSSDWGHEKNVCIPVRCCGTQNIDACGACPTFPCPNMAGFYRENESHARAYGRMCVLRKSLGLPQPENSGALRGSVNTDTGDRNENQSVWTQQG